MARPILSQYGPDSSQPQKPRATKGGCLPGDERDVMNYQAPVIPGWDPMGSMRPGLGGANLGMCGSQGRYSGSDNAKQTTPPTGDGGGGDGQTGIKRSGGEGRGMGTNRKG